MSENGCNFSLRSTFWPSRFSKNELTQIARETEYSLKKRGILWQYIYLHITFVDKNRDINWQSSGSQWESSLSYALYK